MLWLEESQEGVRDEIITEVDFQRQIGLTHAEIRDIRYVRMSRLYPLTKEAFQ